jgi:hypothetical protein
VLSINLVLNLNAPIFTPGVKDYFGVVLERSGVPWSPSPKSKDEDNHKIYPKHLPLDNYRRRREPIDAVIREQEGTSRYRNGSVPALLHYLTLANSTALHMYRRKTASGVRTWGVEPGVRVPSHKVARRARGA